MVHEVAAWSTCVVGKEEERKNMVGELCIAAECLWNDCGVMRMKDGLTCGRGEEEVK